jgi:hypothetical protein
VTSHGPERSKPEIATTARSSWLAAEATRAMASSTYGRAAATVVCSRSVTSKSAFATKIAPTRMAIQTAVATTSQRRGPGGGGRRAPRAGGAVVSRGAVTASS